MEGNPYPKNSLIRYSTVCAFILGTCFFFQVYPPAIWSSESYHSHHIYLYIHICLGYISAWYFSMVALLSWTFLISWCWSTPGRYFQLVSCILFKKNGGSWLFILHTSHRDLGDVTCVCLTSSSWILLCFDDLNFVFRIRGNMLKPFLELFKVEKFWAEYVWHLFSSLS